MSLAQRVRDFRYSKGWGPDELASRAAISRTALYQIESGKTELPRAGTLRRIAMALDVSMENLLGHGDPATLASRSVRGPSQGANVPWSRPSNDWVPAEGAPLASPTPRLVPRFDVTDGPRFSADLGAVPAPAYDPPVPPGNRELVGKFQELLDSPLGDAVARIVEESYRLLPPMAAVVSVSAASRAL